MCKRIGVRDAVKAAKPCGTLREGRLEEGEVQVAYVQALGADKVILIDETCGERGAFQGSCSVSVATSTDVSCTEALLHRVPHACDSAIRLPNGVKQDQMTPDTIASSPFVPQCICMEALQEYREVIDIGFLVKER